MNVSGQVYEEENINDAAAAINFGIQADFGLGAQHCEVHPRFSNMKIVYWVSV